MGRFGKEGGRESWYAHQVMYRPRRILLAFLTAILIIGGSGSQAQVVSVAVAENAIGVLIVIRSDGRTERLEGEGALPLYEGDELRTGPDAKARVKFHDGTRCALNMGTTVVIGSRWDREVGITRILRLFLGELWIKTAEARRLEVETPTANASIRETEFNLKVFPDGRSVLTVVEGVVAFGTAFGTCPIRAGTMSVGERGKKCTKPAPVDVKPAVAWVEEIIR